MAYVSIVSNTKAVLRRATRGELRLVDEALSFLVPDHEFMPKFRAGFWDGRRRFFSKLSGFFPLGHLPRVRELLPGIKVVDERVSVQPDIDLDEVKPDLLQGVTIRPDQVKTILAALAAQRGILKVATGGGKTLCAAAFIKILPKRTQVLFVVHTKALLNQTRQVLASYLGVIEDVIGKIGDGAHRIARITVGIDKSIHASMKKSKVFKRWLSDEVGLYIHDECHHARSEIAYAVATACHAQFRFGLSATPFDNPEDQLTVEAPFGPILATITSEELVAIDALAKPTVELYSYKPTEMEETWEWHQVYRDGIVQNAARNEVLVRVVERYVNAKQKVLVLVAQVWHGGILSALFKALKLKHDFVHAKIPSVKIEAAKEKFRDQANAYLLIASPVFGEGVDIPAVNVLVVADGGKSLKQVVQKSGRGMRKKKTKEANVVTIVDFVDTGHLYLARHTEQRIKIYEDEKFEVVAR